MKILLMKMLNWPMTRNENWENWTDWPGAVLKILSTQKDLHILRSKTSLGSKLSTPLWTPFYPFGELHFGLLSAFYRKLSEYNVKSLMEGCLGADHTNFSSLMTIPLNFSREHWELLLDHIFDKPSDFRPLLTVPNWPSLIWKTWQNLMKPK